MRSFGPKPARGTHIQDALKPRPHARFSTLKLCAPRAVFQIRVIGRKVSGRKPRRGEHKGTILWTLTHHGNAILKVFDAETQCLNASCMPIHGASATMGLCFSCHWHVQVKQVGCMQDICIAFTNEIPENCTTQVAWVICNCTAIP